MSNEANVGLFLACYEIGEPIPGAQLFRAAFSVYTPDHTLSGQGVITQTTNPPLDIQTNLTGDYTYMTVMPNESKILVTATGFPKIAWPPHGGIGPVILPNVQLRMVLDSNWKTGIATYKYRTGVLEGLDDWHEVKNVPVKLVPSLSVEESEVLA